jgi:hypothetical protein
MLRPQKKQRAPIRKKRIERPIVEARRRVGRWRWRKPEPIVRSL